VTGSQAALLAVPLIEDRARKVRVNVTLPHDLLQAIDAMAAARGITRSAFLASASRRELDADLDPRSAQDIRAA
jgi:metal-responsive CopG/Arc/MetJ family transcriptional regulator